MRERAVTHDQLAGVIGVTPGTLKITLHRRLPASQRVQDSLKAWLDRAEVADGVTAPFRARPTANNGTHAPGASA
jgi:hypothetical protein